MNDVRVIDSHTEGEPTRVVIAGGPTLPPGDAHARREHLHARADGFRTFVIGEPRGFDAMVGALLLEPVNPDAVAQVIFFNDAGYLGMCVHGTLGVGRTLLHLGRIGPGRHRIETPVGDVVLLVDPAGSLAVENVVSYRLARAVTVETVHHGPVTGDVAYGGNWFFLVDRPGVTLDRAGIPRWTAFAQDVMDSLARSGITGTSGAPIDHVELFGPPTRPDADSRNFVLCPGGQYDRSPCGTGTSAKLACLHAEGRLAAGAVWRQESVLGTLFTGSVRPVDGGVVPTLAGGAWITGVSTLRLAPDDPFPFGIRS